MIRSRTRSEDGVMLVELLVGMVLMAIIGTIVLDGIVGGFSAQRGLQQRGDALSQVRTTAQRVLRQVREEALLQLATAQTLVVSRPDGNGGTVCFKWDFAVTGSVAALKQYTATDATCSSWGNPTPVIDNLDPSVLPFGYGHRSQWSPPAGITGTPVDPVSCAISGTSPVKYSRYCIGTVTLHLTKLIAGHSPVVVDATTDLRNL